MLFITKSVKNATGNFSKVSAKLSVKEFFPGKVTVNRPGNNNGFLQRNFSHTKFKLSYLTSCKKSFGILSNG